LLQIGIDLTTRIAIKNLPEPTEQLFEKIRRLVEMMMEFTSQE
jgi:hypothetical protein